ncbi:hypothetical protein CH381_30845 [Leptospira sp. mixed culture ATI2-C-A1]|nr:hypothetical protein CH381_30845 [Leptospira sp. mixed culture ATI2-C-A1]
MKFYIIGIILIASNLYAETFFEKQIKLRTEKSLSVYTGINSISYYYYMPFIGISYLLDSKNEIGINLIFSKYSSNDSKDYLPSSNYLIIKNENFSFNQNSAKLFYNRYLFNSPFFFNATLGSLPTITQSYNAQIIPLQHVSNFSHIDINVTRKSTAYFSPGIGLKLILDNGIFFSIVGGPVFIFDNQIESNSSIYLASNSDFQNIYANFFFNSLINTGKKELLSFSRKQTEAYIDFSAGISF